MTFHHHTWRTVGPSLLLPGAVYQRCECGAKRIAFDNKAAPDSHSDAATTR